MSIILNAEQYGLTPNKDISAEINRLFASLKGDKEEKELKLKSGVYYIDTENVPRPTLFITNTIGDNEWRKGEVPHKNAVGLYFDNIENLTLDGNGSTFVIRGQATNIAAVNCKNLTLKNFSITTENPDMHELKVLKRGFNYIDYELDAESEYVKERRLYFVGKDYKTAFNDSKIASWWNARIFADDRDAVIRVRHPFASAISVKELSKGVFRARYFIAPQYNVGDVFCLFENRRKYQGIFGDRCENLSLENLSSDFNYGLSTVFQDCTDLTIRNCRFAPKKNRKMTSVADFIQVCSCRGEVKIENNYFEGAGDDCLNVHGIHFSIDKVDGNKLTVRFRHKQTHGFNPFRDGDSIRFIDTKSLLTTGENEIASAKLIDENTLILETKLPTEATHIGEVVENATACPNVVFKGNTLTRIITRGILLTTSGKILIENNKFLNNSMHSVLISDDAKSWYESGFVTDVTIKNNYFGRCIGYTLFVKPENTVFNGYVHKNISFVGNTIESKNGEGGFYIKDSDKVTLADNVIIGKVKDAVFVNSNVKTERT